MIKSEIEIKQSIEMQEKLAVRFWRAFRPVVVAKSDDKEPIWFCPQNAISIGQNKLVIDYNKCDGCLICVRECHSGCIKEERETR